MISPYEILLKSLINHRSLGNHPSCGRSGGETPRSCLRSTSHMGRAGHPATGRDDGRREGDQRDGEGEWPGTTGLQCIYIYTAYMINMYTVYIVAGSLQGTNLDTFLHNAFWKVNLTLNHGFLWPQECFTEPTFLTRTSRIYIKGEPLLWNSHAP